MTQARPGTSKENSLVASAVGAMKTNLVSISGKEVFAWRALQESHVNNAKHATTTRRSDGTTDWENDDISTNWARLRLPQLTYVISQAEVKM